MWDTKWNAALGRIMINQGGPTYWVKVNLLSEKRTLGFPVCEGNADSMRPITCLSPVKKLGWKV